MIKESKIEDAYKIGIPIQIFLLPDIYSIKGFLFCRQHINHRFFNNLPNQEKELLILRKGKRESDYHDRIRRLQIDFIDRQLYKK